MTAWTDERIERLRALHADGLSAGAIALELGCGLTRNAVIGKLDRSGIKQGRASVTLKSPAEKPATRPPRTRPRKPSWNVPTEPLPPEPLPIAEPKPRNTKTFAELRTGECRYPYGEEPAVMRFCGRPVYFGTSYCLHHVCVTTRT